MGRSRATDAQLGTRARYRRLRLAGVKFSDAELVGIPFRVTIGKRGLADRVAELTDRATGETVKVPLDDNAEHVRKTVATAISGQP